MEYVLHSALRCYSDPASPLAAMKHRLAEAVVEAVVAHRGSRRHLRSASAEFFFLFPSFLVQSLVE